MLKRYREILRSNSQGFFSAQPDWAYKIPDCIGPDTQICWTGLNPDIHFKTFYIPNDRISLNFLKRFQVLKVGCPEKKTSGFQTIWILTILRTSGPDVTSSRGLAESLLT